MIELKPLYNVNLIAKDRKHFYTFNEDPTYYPGVTTPLGIINKPYLKPWVAKVCGLHTMKILLKTATKHLLTKRFIETLYNRSKIQHRLILDKAADMGSRAHAVFDAMVTNKALLGENIAVSDDIRVAVDGFEAWRQLKTIKIELGDTKVGDKELGYGGSLDALGTDSSGRIVIIDYKTSNQMDTVTYPMQVAAYSNAFAKMYGLDYMPDGYIIRFGKEKPEIEVGKVADIKYSFEAFKVCLDLYNKLATPQMIERKTFKYKKPKKEKSK